VVQYCITNTLQVAFRDPFLIIGYLVLMIGISWQLSLFAVIFLPIVGVIIGSIVKKLRHPAKRGQERMGDMVSVLDESLSGMKIVKGYNATEFIINKFKTLNADMSRLLISMARRQQLASPMSEFLGITAVAVILVFGGTLVSGGMVTGAGFIAFIAAFSQITRPLRSFIDQFANINQGVAAGERIFTIIDAQSEVADKEDAREFDGLKQSIELRNVHFSYDGEKEVINNVSLRIGKGETIALVGPSGGGKSTLSELIPRFYDVTKGDILFDGVSIKEYSQESLRSKMSIVSQETVLFNDSIEGNILMGRPTATHSDVVEACKVANADSFIMASPEGYDTNIGDRGTKLSGGQRQRLSIARAVLKNPEILILDEATSALDTESEKLVQDALTNLLKGRTSIVIAHRLSTIYNADRIYVIDQGRIAEQGTHQELLDKGGIYAHLIEMQSFS
ncbi:MAG: ABC transporter ATP-binding protein, partial [Alistipes sp.]|nr:ABC transporter ATP-binding protein [Alistipes sp.]